MTMMHELIQERWDAYMRHCVAGVTKSGKDKNAAFAICKAGGNKAGYYQAGTKRVTAKGRKAMRAHSRDAAAKAKDAAYDKAIKQEGTMTGMRRLIERCEMAEAMADAADGHKYMVVGLGPKTLYFETEEDLIKGMKRYGISATGKRHPSHSVRGIPHSPVIVDQPKFDKLNGPMKHNDTVRYESPEAYAELSR